MASFALATGSNFVLGLLTLHDRDLTPHLYGAQATATKHGAAKCSMPDHTELREEREKLASLLPVSLPHSCSVQSASQYCEDLKRHDTNRHLPCHQGVTSVKSWSFSGLHLNSTICTSKHQLNLNFVKRR